MQGRQLLAHGGTAIPLLKPVQHRHLEVRQTPTLAERQKRAAGRDGDDRDSRHAVDQLRVHDDQRAVGRELGQFDSGSRLRRRVARLFC